MGPLDEARRRATIYSVADQAGVSIATVSRVLQGSAVVSERTRQKVLDAVDELDYLPSGAARSLAVRHHDTYGLVLPELSGPYYAELLVGFETRAAELDQSVMLVLAGGQGGPRPRGAHPRHPGRRHRRARRAMPCTSAPAAKPVVVIAGPARTGIEAIAAENVDARPTADRAPARPRPHAGCASSATPTAAPDLLERYEGFVAAHEQRGLTPAEPVRAEFRERDGTAVAERLLAGEFTADALVCGNDELALAVMARLTDSGVDVPDDLADRRLGRRHDRAVRAARA